MNAIVTGFSAQRVDGQCKDQFRQRARCSPEIGAIVPFVPRVSAAAARSPLAVLDASLLLLARASTPRNPVEVHARVPRKRLRGGTEAPRMLTQACALMVAWRQCQPKAVSPAKRHGSPAPARLAMVAPAACRMTALVQDAAHGAAALLERMHCRATRQESSTCSRPLPLRERNTAARLRNAVRATRWHPLAQAGRDTSREENGLLLQVVSATPSAVRSTAGSHPAST